MNAISFYFTSALSHLLDFFNQSTYVGNIVLIILAFGLLVGVINVLLYIIKIQ